MFFGGSKRILEPNMFIGFSNVVDPNNIANDKFYSPESVYSPKNISIDANNVVSFYTDKIIKTVLDAFRYENINFLIDVDGKLLETNSKTGGDFGFFGRTMFNFYHAENLDFIGRQAMQSTGITEHYLPVATYIGARNFVSNPLSLRSSYRIYIPNVTTLNASFLVDPTNSYSGAICYANPYLKTNNGGDLDSNLQEFQNDGGTIVWVTDTTPPDAISDLSASNITSTSFDLNFTTPTSVNGIQAYEVYLDNGNGHILQRYKKHVDIISSGSTISGLTSGLTYKARVRTRSNFYTKSDFSNEIEITLP